MILKDGNAELTVPGVNYTEHDQLYMSILLRLIEKGRENPAFQLHTLALLFTGKNFTELCTGRDVDIEQLVEVLKLITRPMVENMSIKGDISQSTIDDFLSQGDG